MICSPNKHTCRETTANTKITSGVKNSYIKNSYRHSAPVLVSVFSGRHAVHRGFPVVEYQCFRALTASLQAKSLQRADLSQIRIKKDTIPAECLSRWLIMIRSLAEGRDIFCQVAVLRVLCKSSGEVGCCTLRTSADWGKGQHDDTLCECAVMQNTYSHLWTRENTAQLLSQRRNKFNRIKNTSMICKENYISPPATR